MFGEVRSTDFEELTVDLQVEGVKDESIQLPEIVRVPLSSIYPTIFQENAVNADITADILDRFRFFYNYIFLPFDSEEKNWAQKNLIARVQLFFDLNNSKSMSKGMSSHLRQLFAEAKYIQEKRDLLESSMEGNDSYENLDLSKEDSKETAAKLLELHLRMNHIKNEIEILANPEMRDVYESLKFPTKDVVMNEKRIFVINKEGTINDQIQLLEKLKSKIETHDKIHWMQDLNFALEQAVNSSLIYIPSGTHSLKFLEYLNSNIFLCGLNVVNKIEPENLQNYAIIKSFDLSPMLFAINGDIKIQNLVFDCSYVTTGFLIREGCVTFENCYIFGKSSSTVTEAFNLSDNCNVILDNCIITSFGTAMNVNNAKVTVKNSVIEKCNTAIAFDDDSIVSLEGSNLRDIKEHAIIKYTTSEEATFLESTSKDELDK